MRHSIVLFFLALPSLAWAQIVFAAGASGNLYRIELSDCSVKTIGKGNIFGDLAMDPTTKELYGINVRGLYIIDTLTGQDSFICETVDVNAMTFGRDGTLYAASGGSIYTINKNTGKFKRLGIIKNYTSAGDLTFFQGDLYLTVLGNELIRVNLKNIEKSRPLGGISGVRGGVFHGVTAVGCTNMYGFASKDVYEIRPGNLRKAEMKCPIVVDDYIFGAASYQEAGLPDFSLGKDSFLCDGDTLDYTFDTPTATYTWQDTFVGPEYHITEPGTYWVNINYTKCNFKDTVQVTFGTVPKIELGPDTVLCPTEKLELKAYWPGSTYLWHDSSNTSEFVVREPGLHWVVAKLQNCGSDTDSVFIRFKDKLKPDLGPDQYICDSVSIVLRSNLGERKVRWQDGTRNDSFIVRSPGTYWLKGFAGNCAYVDTLHILGHGTSPRVSLGNDTAMCYGDTLPLNALTSAIRYQWSTNSSKPTIDADSSGMYWVIAQSEHCGSDTDSVQVTIYPNLQPNFNGDTVLCDSDTLILRVNVPGAFVRWQGAVSGDSFLVTRPGNYGVKVRLAHCLQDDSLQVAYESSPAFDLGPDTILCNDSLYNLRISGVDAEYLWSDGSQQPIKEVDTSGSYWAVASSKHCGLYRDTVLVTFVEASIPSLGPDTTICEDDSFLLLLPLEHDSILWSNGSQGPSIYPKGSAEYFAQVYWKGCHYNSDTVVAIVYDCNCPIHITNVFSPNGDAYNEGFKPTHQCHFAFYHFQIFNRWGQCVFESNDPDEQWKGTLESGPTIFVYVLHYQQHDMRDHKRTGSIMLLR